jgi:2-C-methyl-D-erythritol 2,4-cyclodiphosphate synthase
MRIGHGYDIHRLTSGRDLVLGGVRIPFEKGLLGHSDADVLLHAICDALLGAAGLGDIGIHFPDTDPRFKDVSSIGLLKSTVDMIRKKGFEIVNIDTTVFAEMPKLAPYGEAIKERISTALGVSRNRINIKATTMEGLGAIGKGEGIGAECVVLIESANLKLQEEKNDH